MKLLIQIDEGEKAVPPESMADSLANSGLGYSSTDTKYTKVESTYRKADSPDERCGTCSHYEPHAYHSGLCALVAGSIDPDYLCDYWDSNPVVANSKARNQDHGILDDSID